MSPHSFHPDSNHPDSNQHILFDPASELQREAASVMVATYNGAEMPEPDANHLESSDEIICLDPDVFSEIPPERRFSAWFAPLAWHADAVALPREAPRRVMVLDESLKQLFPRAETRLMAYPLRRTGFRRSDRDSIRQRLGLSPGRVAVYCREESSQLMRVMKALENDERITVLTVEEATDLDRHHPQGLEAMLMSACDLFVAESSATVVAESMTYGVPLVAFVRDGGDANARFLLEAGAGLVAARPGEMLMLLDAVTASFPTDVQRMRAAIDRLRGRIAVGSDARRTAGVPGA